jgi:hypothetical protein
VEGVYLETQGIAERLISSGPKGKRKREFVMDLSDYGY